MNQNEINVTANYLKKLASLPDAENRIALYLDSLFACASQQKGSFDVQQNTAQSVSSKIIFTQKEINQMPKTFKKEFRADGCTAHVRKRKSSKNCYVYDIRYRHNGYNILVTNTDLETAKRLFIEKLKTAKPIVKKVNSLSNLHTFTLYYFEKFRLPKVSTLTYNADWHRYKNYIQPAFGDKQFKDITPEHCQNWIDGIQAQGKGKTAEEIYSLLSIIFKGAIAHGFMDKNPLNLVVKMKHEGKHGTTLTKDEENLLLSAYPNTKYQTLFALALYTGLRPNEYNTAKIEGQFIIAVNYLLF